MKKVVAILALALFGLGLQSCETESAEETQALYETVDVQSPDTTDPPPPRG